jgi:hypothetical protein
MQKKIDNIHILESAIEVLRAEHDIPRGVWGNGNFSHFITDSGVYRPTKSSDMDVLCLIKSIEKEIRRIKASTV